MTNIKVITISLICVLIVGNMVLVWNTHRLKAYYSKQIFQKDENPQDFLLREQLMFELSESIKIPDQYIDKDGLFFIFSGNMCHSCIEQELDQLFTHCDNKLSKTYFICFTDDIQVLKRFNKIYKLPNVEIITSKHDWGFNIEEYDIPIVFIKKSKHSISHIFIPNKQNTRFSEQYYKLWSKIL